MNNMRGSQKRASIALVMAFLLTGCGQLPSWMPGQQQTQQFHPLDSEVAQIAAPQPPASAPSLYCRIGRGDAHFSRGWSGYDAAPFSLAPEARITIPVTKKKGDEKIQVLGYFDTAGQKLIFCPIVDGPPGKRIACASLYALDDDLNAGIKRTFDIPSSIRGASITCAYKETALQKL